MPPNVRSAAQIRREFLDYFRDRGHAIVPASPVIPHDDPTLLFTNAGMNQFKDVFLGSGTRGYARAADSQPCIRAGGKHNDLDDVGMDTYHHTCFEMLGNWSFGDYFKAEAIEWAWELLTRVWGLDPQRLHATYFEGDPAQGVPADTEARDLWKKIAGLPDARIHPGNRKDNFWEMGETGPCGPCSEIHIDLTPDVSGGKLVNAGDARVMEIWNLVFIQFNRNPDQSLTPLPARHVDTGMGFERICSVVQGMDHGRLGRFSNYDTDVFSPLFNALRDISKAPAYAGTLPDPAGRSRAESPQVMIDVAYRVIADHIRTLTFAIADGCLPDKEGRGYVLRRILRRAVRYGYQYLGLKQPFLHRLAPTVADLLGDAFPRLRENPQRVSEALREEEASFGRTLERGLALFEEAADTARREHHGELRGADAFRLHDTFGFPIDLTQIMAAEHGLRVDIGEYERLMEQARERARGGGRSATAAIDAPTAARITAFGATDDHWKFEQEALTARIVGLLRADGDALRPLDGPASSLSSGQSGAIVLDRTCFYGEQGGQVGDSGVIRSATAEFRVERTLRVSDSIVHAGTLGSGALRTGDSVELSVSPERARTRSNHTATHLLNWALREVLGEHVQQKGSLVDAQRTRFDFSNPRAPEPAELERVERLCNEQAQRGLVVHAAEAPQADALKINGLRAVFGEKYPDRVRVVSIGPSVADLLADPAKSDWRGYSVEFCGGTHVRNTREIGRFALVSEEAVAKGVRRVVGLTGPDADRADAQADALLAQADALAREKAPEALSAGLSALNAELAGAMIPLVRRAALRSALESLQARQKEQSRANAADSLAIAVQRVDELIAAAERFGDSSIVVGEMPDLPAEQLKHAADLVRSRCGSCAVLFGVRVPAGEKSPPKAIVLAAVSDDLIRRGVKAGDLVKAIAPLVDGGGGGPPTLAQAGGKSPEKLDLALRAGRDWIHERLAK
ncbi:MAG: alanine--tRNA ligase [Planctomycetia bacterium]|nr:MAG: alanine--tRNA ligase [Planctomycetia bacterium]